MFAFLVVLLILDSLLLAVVVLLQSGSGGGLAAMGGSASTDSFIGGRQAVTVLTKMSWWCGGIFLGISLILAGMSTHTGTARSVLQGQLQTPAENQPVPLNLQPEQGAAGGSPIPGAEPAPAAGAPSGQQAAPSGGQQAPAKTPGK